MKTNNYKNYKTIIIVVFMILLILISVVAPIKLPWGIVKYAAILGIGFWSGFLFYYIEIEEKDY